MKFKNLCNIIYSKFLMTCALMLIHSGYNMQWRKPFLCLLFLVPFSFFLIFGIIDEKMMPGGIRFPNPYSVIPLYPSRVPLLDLKHFKYLINNDVCQEDKVFAVVIIHSHPANKDVRDIMRRNIPSEDLVDIGIRRVFLLARSEWDDQALYKKTPQANINEENIIHKDIVQGNFKEHYHNLTYKHVMGLQWATTFCPDVKYIIKMDDDIIVDLYHFRDILKYRYTTRNNLILGLLLVGNYPVRDITSKWYVSRKEYPAKVYPNFVSGWAYAMSIDAAKKIISVSQKFPYFWIDDVHVTGTLAEATSVKREGLNRYYSIYPAEMQCCVDLPKSSEYLCDYIVGACDGDHGLMEKLLRHSRNCFVQPCTKRPPEIRLSKTCIFPEKDTKMLRGKGEVFLLN